MAGGGGGDVEEEGEGGCAGWVVDSGVVLDWLAFRRASLRLVEEGKGGVM